MASIAEIRKQYPQYEDLSDHELADKLHGKFYSDMPVGEFYIKAGIGPRKLEGTVDQLPAPEGGRSDNIEYTPQTTQQKYDEAANRVRERYFPNLSDEQWHEYITTGPGKPLDSLGLLNDSLTMGLSDEAGGAAGAVAHGLDSWENMGRAFGDFQALEQARRDLGEEQSGLLGTGAKVAGAIMSGRPWNAALTAPTTAGKVVQAAGDAAVQGGIYGFASAEGDLADRAMGGTIGAGTGAAIGTAAPLVAKGASDLWTAVTQRGADRAASRAAPTAKTIKSGSRAAYKQMEATGASVTMPALQKLKNNMQAAAKAEGLLFPSGQVSTAYPKISDVMRAVDEFTQAPLDMKSLQTLHRHFRRAAGSVDPQEATMGGKMLDAFEDWVDTLPSSAFAGRGDDAMNYWAKGKSEWARFKKVQTIELAIERARRAKGGFAAGLRTQFNRILDNAKRQRGFTQSELEAMRKFAEGGKIEDFIGFLNGLRGLASAAGLHMLGAGPLALGMLGAGAGGKMLLNRGAKKMADQLRVNAAMPGGIPQVPRRTIPPDVLIPSVRPLSDQSQPAIPSRRPREIPALAR